jgi:UrcA family protein
MTKTILTIAAAALFALTAAPAAFAANVSDKATFTVSTAGLDLRIQRDARQMARRIENAASAACGGAPYIGDLTATHDFKACLSHNVGQAVTQLGSPMVAALAHQPMAAQTASSGR